ncbi:hypothetical protein QNO00_15830 [Arthrobacter sp. zg-Y1219]|uniref:hypothetical protein n=1 Tax=Arthrobacter sp. zg-Y1219 TaxID=3049067 RepID=UPI0024C35FE4|nr:hypothetical protein [Arthrobacter sp. zg-Y1219]MDK1361724.1 hypothetical protein [Arthrobacter sp. zg-Y1219]
MSKKQQAPYPPQQGYPAQPYVDPAAIAAAVAQGHAAGAAQPVPGRRTLTRTVARVALCIFPLMGYALDISLGVWVQLLYRAITKQPKGRPLFWLGKKLTIKPRKEIPLYQAQKTRWRVNLNV